MLNAEAERIGKTFQSISSPESFIQAAQTAGLAFSGPVTFVATEIPESLIGVNESTTQVLETAGLGKVTPAIQTVKGDFLFLRVNTMQVPKDEATAKEVDQLMVRLNAQNAYLMRVGLMVNLIEPPTQAEK
jgi:sugar diacid utilization regulator